MLAATVAGVVEHRRRRRRSAEWPIVAHVGPEPAGDGLALGQHRHGGVITVDPRSGQHVGTDQRHQRRQRGRAGADPVAHGGDIEVDVLTRIRLTLTIAGELLPHRLDHLPLPRDHLQRLGDRLAELGQFAAAARTLGRARDDDPLAR